MPVVIVDSTECVVLIPSLTNLPATDLKHVVVNVGLNRESIVAALDHLFLRA
ncbi:MAG: CcdB family protein [Gammaproteobacteria bacterium]